MELFYPTDWQIISFLSSLKFWKDSTIQNSNLAVLPMAFDFIAFTMSSAVRAVMLVFFSIARQKWHLFAEPMASLEFLPSCDSK